MSTKPARAVKTPGAPEAASEPLPESPAAAPEPQGVANAVDVDARFIRGPVMTRQGWVVPDEAWQKANRAAFDAYWAKQG